MRTLHRTLSLVALALVLSACATHSTVQEPIQAPAPSVVGPGPTIKAPRCVAGNGHVVRLAQVDPANDPGSAMHGGVLGSVLDGPADKNADSTHAGSGPGHDIYVQMDDGRKLIVNQRDLGGIGMGSRVAVDADCRARPIR
ncbi:MAG TPA: hypothetical protein VK753_08545 [Xanthomonadaceae bacterium]|jgi:hypothetical protein|nr:hypothetical protein [Xanthomonadaceae bacterium]